MHRDAEYVDPHLLLPYREYAWSREHNWCGREEWDRLREDVAQHGFRQPVVLSYNHETGHGYLGEGNHRVGIAVELGVPVPLVIYRSSKTAPDWPMKPITSPGEYSMRDANGYSRFGQIMRPSDIGLPTVEPQRDIAADRDRDGSGFEL